MVELLTREIVPKNTGLPLKYVYLYIIIGTLQCNGGKGGGGGGGGGEEGGRREREVVS